MSYTVNLASSGNYTFTARVASPNSWNTFHLEVDGADITGPIYIPNTGSGDTYQFVGFDNIPLVAGQRTLSVVIEGSGAGKGNFDYFTIEPYFPPPVLSALRDTQGRPDHKFARCNEVATIDCNVRQLSVMRTTKLLLAVVAICGLVVTVPAQRKRDRQINRDVRISKRDPTVYITFEGIGRDQDIWLRLHNNTRWRIEFPTVAMSWGRDFVPYYLTDEYRLAGRGRGTVAKPRYNVEERDGTPVSTVQPAQPTSFSVGPGHSVLFKVSREHLSEGRNIFLNFYYGWESGEGYDKTHDPIHRVEFRSKQLPRSGG